jgi:signal transduction histidine kinase
LAHEIRNPLGSIKASAQFLAESADESSKRDPSHEFLGIIVEEVEAERQIVDILELEIGYGQGHLFGEPRPIRDAVLAETTPPSDFMRPATRKRVARRG